MIEILKYSNVNDIIIWLKIEQIQYLVEIKKLELISNQILIFLK